MEQKLKSTIAFGLLMLVATITNGQIQKVQQGVVFKKGTSVRIANAKVYNKRAGYTLITNNFGLFSMLASAGDTLEISHEDYASRTVIVSAFKDELVFLPPSNTLAEVTVKGESVKQRLKEVEDSYRSKGIYYKGRPPLSLLSPFGGSPLTFFHELLSKDGKRARRFQEFSEQESDYYEIASRFNDNTIKRIVPIKDEDLADFKLLYRPKIELIRTGTDFELFKYIKTSYQEFIKNKQ